MLERHGFTRGNDPHAGRAIVLIGDLARSREGTQDHPYVPSITQSVGLPPPEPPGLHLGPPVPEDDPGTVTLTRTPARTVPTALDLAADWKRGRAGRCIYCADRSCPRRQLRLLDARTYHQFAVYLRYDEHADRDTRSQPKLAVSPASPLQPSAPDGETGQ